MGLSRDDARALFDRRRTAWLAEDVDGYLDCWVDDLVLETPGGVVRGRAEYEWMVRGSLGWAKPRTFEVHHLGVDAVLRAAEAHEMDGLLAGHGRRGMYGAIGRGATLGQDAAWTQRR